ncbi:HNH endonuclease [Kribbella soli]|uniref:HNH endonuclease n=2 Tax=Kribbella soli TaxID=1124743 RepID=A0A4R0HCK1_9ACTN|nr:HNH endonuclease [Kribbella soli]
MSGGEMVSALDATYAEIARLKTYALQLTAGLETIGYAKEVGAGTTARFLTLRYRVDATEARRDVHLANALPKYPAVAAALPDPNPDHAPETAGDEGGAGSGVLVHPAQAEAIVSALDRLPNTVPAEDLRVAEQEMVELARTHGPLDLRKAGVQVRNRLDTDGPEPAEQQAYDRETLKLKNADNGVAFSGFLANENAELFRTLIHTHAKPRKTVDGALDPRTRDKRQADALITVLNAANTSGHGSTPHITVTIDFNDLKAATADATGQLIYGEALSAATIRRLACDAHILPVVIGSDSQPLDLGTTVRLATGPMRKALIARDKGCVCCGAPPIYCDAHHVISWIDGGETKIENLVLLCKRCHRDLHAGHWNIHIANGIVDVARPTWATPDPVPRGRYRPPTTTRGSSRPDATSAGAPARAWPRDTDPPWITAEETAHLNPWGDAQDSGRAPDPWSASGPDRGDNAAA